MIDRIFPFHKKVLVLALMMVALVVAQGGFYLVTGQSSFIRVLFTDPSAADVAIVAALFLFVELEFFFIWKLDDAFRRRASKKHHANLQGTFS